MDDQLLVVSTVSDDPLASDIASCMKQFADISDLMGIKCFANTEFCPRFLSDEHDLNNIGHSLQGKTVVIVSSCSGEYSRNSRAMRTFLLARAAKENGAERVILVEPDLFYSAQDRGPNSSPYDPKERPRTDFKKFDGQPFSALLYAELLKTSGVDDVLTLHNHSTSVQQLFSEQFNGRFFNISPAQVYSEYLANHESFLNPGYENGFLLCAPDQGAEDFVENVHYHLSCQAKGSLLPMNPSILKMSKERSSERRVCIQVSKDSPTRAEEIVGREVVVFDDMVRTGNTIVECCKSLKQFGASRVIFVVTHFYSSAEVKENLNDSAIDDIITTNTLPSILNRDMQGRLRRKMLILKIERLIANTLSREILKTSMQPFKQQYTIDVSRKNLRWKNIAQSQQNE